MSRAREAVLAAAGILLLLSGCASTSGSQARGRELQLRYAEVVNIDRVEMPSSAPAGAMLGGFTGLALSGGRSGRTQIGRAAGGALIGAGIAKAIEGDRLGYAYDLRFAHGGESRFITEKGFLEVGDCVVVERGEFTNLRRVASSYCVRQDLPNEATQLRARSAEQCEAAKQQLLEAPSDEAIANAARKVELLCQF